MALVHVLKRLVLNTMFPLYIGFVYFKLFSFHFSAIEFHALIFAKKKLICDYSKYNYYKKECHDNKLN